jgi:protein-disulfide isomerase
MRRARAARKARAARSEREAKRAGGVSWTTGSIGLGVIVLIAAVIVGFLIWTGRSDRRTTISDRALRTLTEHKVNELLRGIPQNGNILGQPTAPVTLQIFADLECLTAKNFIVRLLPAIIREFVRTNGMRIEYRSFKTDTRAQRAFVMQQAAALAAGEQKEMWNFIETFYYEQGREYSGYATERYLEGIASQVSGLDHYQWISDRESIEMPRHVIEDDRVARAIGLHTTPSFRIGRTGGEMKKLTGEHIVLEFPGFRKMANPVSLIDAHDLKRAIERLP